MKYALTAALAATLISRSALAVQCGGRGPELKEPALCSKLFEFSGTCGTTPYPNWTPDVAFAVGPWERTPIRIFSISGDVTVRATWRAVIAKMFLGNSFNADPMTPYVNAAGGIMDLSGRVAVPLHVEQRFTVGMQFAAAGPLPLDPHLDVHLICEPKGAAFFGSLTVWYTLDR
jgi:hypothetical protein